MADKVLITGITGFLGAHLATEFLSHNYEVIGLTRNNSNFWRLSNIKDRIFFVNSELPNWKEQLINLAPSVIIHSAWSGVSAKDRDDWRIQYKNLDLLFELLYVSKEAGIKKFIAFGSQAEYGLFSGIVSEEHELRPTAAYGFFKIKAMDMIKFFSETEKIDWYWLRLFSVYGEMEDDHWFIPSIVKSIINNEELETTKGEQKYAYMYVKDLCKLILKIVRLPVHPDVYNISSKTVHSLKSIVERLTGIIGSNETRIKFGAIPYRKNQTMHMQGDISKLEKEIGIIQESNLDDNLEKIVAFIKGQTNKR